MRIDGTEYDITTDELEHIIARDMPLAPYAECLLELADDYEYDPDDVTTLNAAAGD